MPPRVLLLALLGTAAWSAPVLPTVGAEPSLGKPNAHRMRISVSKDAVVFKPTRGEAAKKVSVLKDWKPADDDRRGKVILSLGAAIDASIATKPATPDLAIDGWAEVWIDRGAPIDLVTIIWCTLIPRLQQVAIGVKAPGGERTVEFLLTHDLSQADALLTVAIDDGELVITSGEEPELTLKHNAANMKKATAAFEKKNGKGRVERRAVLGAWECVDSAGKPVAAERCWHGRVVFSADDHATWGDVAPMAAAAQTVVPDVAFMML
jgi:hypothetical protein